LLQHSFSISTKTILIGRDFTCRQLDFVESKQETRGPARNLGWKISRELPWLLQLITASTAVGKLMWLLLFITLFFAVVIVVICVEEEHLRVVSVESSMLFQ